MGEKSSATSRFDRARAALIGGATGDALGMPSQTLTRAEIKDRYGVIKDFIPPCDGHPVSHGLNAANITDDTEQTLALAKLLIESPHRFDGERWAQALLAWEQDVEARGLLDLLGPSSKQALQALLSGTPISETGKDGTTNGAAMRIAPVGIATPAEPLEPLIDQVELTCRVTHNTGEAIAAAAAVAAVVSLGIEGHSIQESLPTALKAAGIGNRRGFRRNEVDVAARIRDAVGLTEQRPNLDLFAERVGTSVQSHESVAAAFGLAWMAPNDPWQVAIMAANIGDDTDTIGSIATTMVAASSGMKSLPQDKIEQVIASNQLDIDPIASGLLRIRKEHQVTSLSPVLGA